MFMKKLLDTHSPLPSHSREDISNLLELHGLENINYIETHAMDSVRETLAAWPLLAETTEIMVLALKKPE